MGFQEILDFRNLGRFFWECFTPHCRITFLPIIRPPASIFVCTATSLFQLVFCDCPPKNSVIFPVSDHMMIRNVCSFFMFNLILLVRVWKPLKRGKIYINFFYHAAMVSINCSPFSTCFHSAHSKHSKNCTHCTL